MNYSRRADAASRRMLFDDLVSVVRELGLQPSDIGSILEVGCSLGYLLRHLEVEVFPGCRELLGIDIDGPAIRKGTDYLKRHGSRWSSPQGDMEDLDWMLVPGPSIWSSPPVSSAISTNRMPPAWCPCARRTNKVLAFAGLACTGCNNDQLDRSETSPNHEQQWIHNFAAMVSAGDAWSGAGGRRKLYNLQTIHFVFAVPG